ncbi:MAG TPA: hypothetical protein P5133_13190 [Spirochaetia bacterium]|nr:hypothetical protein [Spirochaetia bacterium]
MSRTPPLPRLFLALLLLAASWTGALASEELWSDSGFFVDMPAGFQLQDGDGKTRFAFADPEGIMEFDILAYESGRYAGAEALAADSIRRLGSAGESESFSYEGRKAVFAELAFGLDGGKRKGFAIYIEGRKAQAPAAAPQAGAPAAKAGAPERHYALLVHAAEADFDSCLPFFLSCLDSFSIDRGARRAPGPLSQYLLPWPPERKALKKVLLPGGASVELPWSPREASQEEETAAREHGVLKAYAEDPELALEAWARFYRMVYRESAARLDRLALELARSLPRDDPTETARRILAWVQLFVYERDLEGIDFVPPLASAYEARGDCDARAVVAVALLERLGIDAILMLSSAYSHALFAVDVPGGGQRFAFGGKNYLVAETTAKVGLGMIAQDQADWSKWLGVQLGD